MLVVAGAECGASVNQSIVLIGVGKQQQQQQPCLRGTGLHICQALCVYRPQKESLSGSMDQTSVLLDSCPLFSKYPPSWGLDRRSSKVAVLIAPESLIISVGGFDQKIRIQLRRCWANRMLQSKIRTLWTAVRWHCDFGMCWMCVFSDEKKVMWETDPNFNLLNIKPP